MYHTSQEQPKKRKAWPWIVGGIIAVIFTICAVGTITLGMGAKAISDEANEQRNDVTLVDGSCKQGEFGWEAEVSITNSSNANRSYWVQVNLVNGNEHLGEAHAIVNNLAPGRTVKEKATGTVDAVKGATCEIVDVK